jgi:tRNA G18 (ribose-2'-O)-methylase SpoU
MKNIREYYRRKREQAMRRYEKHRRRNYLARAGVHEFVVVLDNLKQSFNIGKIFRSADAMGAAAVHLIGTDFFDPSPAKGSFKWVPAVFHDDFSSCYKELQEDGYQIFTLEPEKGQLLNQSNLFGKNAFVFGHEEFGLSFERDDYPEIRQLTIPQFGKVQSLNVSISASIVMYEYVRQASCRGMAAATS